LFFFQSLFLYSFFFYRTMMKTKDKMSGNHQSKKNINK
jgi:ribonucleotide reductase beta subunit family protein with ferritin-like domain